MNKYKIIMFDLDDTLIDNKENVRYAFTIMEKNMGREYDVNNFERWYEIDRKFWRDRQNGLIVVPFEYQEEEEKKSQKFLDWIRAQRVLLYYDNKVTLNRAIELNNIFMESLKEVIVEIEGALDTLEYLSKKYRLVVVTNGPMVAAREKVRKIGGLKYISDVFASEMSGYMKPRKEFFDYVKKNIGYNNVDDYLMVGDSLKSDVEFGTICGFDTCFINKTDCDLGNYKPTIIIKDIRDLKEKL